MVRDAVLSIESTLMTFRKLARRKIRPSSTDTLLMDKRSEISFSGLSEDIGQRRVIKSATMIAA